MIGDNYIYSKAVIMIADYIFAHPDKKMTHILSLYVTKLQKSERTVKRYIKKAKNYNSGRLHLQETAKNEVLTDEAKKVIREAKKEAKSAVISRMEILENLKKKLERLNTIIAGSGYVAKDKHTGNSIGYMQATFSDEVRAIQTYNMMVKQIADIEGYNAAIKVAETDSKGNDLIKDINVNIRKL